MGLTNTLEMEPAAVKRVSNFDNSVDIQNKLVSIFVNQNNDNEHWHYFMREFWKSYDSVWNQRFLIR